MKLRLTELCNISMSNQPTVRDFELAYFGEIYDDETGDYQYTSEEDLFEHVTNQVESEDVSSTYTTDNLEIMVVIREKATGKLWGLPTSLPNSWHEGAWEECYDFEDKIVAVNEQEVVVTRYEVVE